MTAGVNPEVERLCAAYGRQRAALRLALSLLTEPSLTVPDPEGDDVLLAVIPAGLIDRIEEALTEEV